MSVTTAEWMINPEDCPGPDQGYTCKGWSWDTPSRTAYTAPREELSYAEVVAELQRTAKDMTGYLALATEVEQA